MSRFIRFAVGLTALLALGGCVLEISKPYTLPLADSARTSVDTVGVSNVVTVTSAPNFFGGSFDSSLKLGSSAAADAILASGERDDARRLYVFVKAAKIDFAPMVRGEFETQVRQHSFFGPRMATKPNYLLELDVPFYGIVQAHPFSHDYKASIAVRLKLIAPDGEVIADLRAAGDGATYNDLSEMLKKPELLREQYRNAVHEAVQKLLAKF